MKYNNNRVTQYAREWINQPRPRGVRQRRRGQCYYNAGRLVLDNPDLTYVEGYVAELQHAWCIDPEGRVIDPTWRYRPDLTYLGVPFRRKWFAGVLLRSGVWGDLLRQVQEAEDMGEAVAVEIVEQFDRRQQAPN